MMIDTNVILDYLTERDAFDDDERELFDLIDAGEYEGYVSSVSLPNIDYILRKKENISKDQVMDFIRRLLLQFHLVEVTNSDLLEATYLDFKEYEDAIHCQQASRLKLDYIISRNKKHFTNSKVEVLTPKEFLTMMYNHVEA